MLEQSLGKEFQETNEQLVGISGELHKHNSGFQDNPNY